MTSPAGGGTGNRIEEEHARRRDVCVKAAGEAAMWAAGPAVAVGAAVVLASRRYFPAMRRLGVSACTALAISPGLGAGFFAAEEALLECARDRRPRREEGRVAGG